MKTVDLAQFFSYSCRYPYLEEKEPRYWYDKREGRFFSREELLDGFHWEERDLEDEEKLRENEFVPVCRLDVPALMKEYAAMRLAPFANRKEMNALDSLDDERYTWEFRKIVERHGLEVDWLSCVGKELAQIGKQWCGDNGLRFTDDSGRQSMR